MIFEAALVGSIWLGLARVVITGFLWHDEVRDLMTIWSFFTGSAHFVGTSVASVVFAVAGAGALNLLVGFWEGRREPRISEGAGLFNHLRQWWEASRKWALDVTIRRSGNALQKLLHEVAIRGPVDGTTVGLTMSNGKIYAALVVRSPNLSAEDSYLSILPLMSGHRNQENLRPEYDFAYPVEKLLALGEHCGVVVALPVSEIRSAHMLDLGYYKQERDRVIKESSEPERKPPRKRQRKTRRAPKKGSETRSDEKAH